MKKTKRLEEYTLKQVADIYIDEIAKEKGVSKALARKLFINALTYNVVSEEIKGQIDFLLEQEGEKEQ